VNEFTKIAQDYDKGRSGEDVIFWAGETTELARLDEGSIILDLGCGTGIYTVGLREHTSGTICGLDPSVGMLSQVRRKHVPSIGSMQLANASQFALVFLTAYFPPKSGTI